MDSERRYGFKHLGLGFGLLAAAIILGFLVSAAHGGWEFYTSAAGIAVYGAVEAVRGLLMIFRIEF